MKEKQFKNEDFKEIIDEVLWMARRYAHGRHTYAPSIIRDVVKKMKKMFPDWELRKDITIEAPTKEELNHKWVLKSDYLHDI